MIILRWVKRHPIWTWIIFYVLVGAVLYLLGFRSPESVRNMVFIGVIALLLGRSINGLLRSMKDRK
jgi:uncharacterized membrane protein YhaH (DUF805 family)